MLTNPKSPKLSKVRISRRGNNFQFPAARNTFTAKRNELDPNKLINLVHKSVDHDEEDDELGPLAINPHNLQPLPSLLQTKSNNFPDAWNLAQPKSVKFSHSRNKSNNFSDIDEEKEEKCAAPGGSQGLLSPRSRMKHPRMKYLRSKGTQRNLQLGFVGISHDPKLNLDKEVRDIAQNNIDYTRRVFTIEDFKKLLTESPHVVHVSTHGAHHYQVANTQNEFQISLEETTTIRAMIDEDPHFSAYYAVIALFFELEINHFVQYGFKKKEKIQQRLRTWIWKDQKTFPLLMNRKIFAMLQSILQRFGCSFHDNEKQQCVEICWGQCRQEWNAKHKRYDNKVLRPPHPPIGEYHLMNIYKHDKEVQTLYREIFNHYANSGAKNPNIFQRMQKQQGYSWEILCVLLQRKLFEQGAEPDDRDPTRWIEANEQEEDTEWKGQDEDKMVYVNDEFMSDVDPDEAAEFGLSDDDEVDPAEAAEFVSDDEKKEEELEDDEAAEFGLSDDDDEDASAFCGGGDTVTEIKFAQYMELTRELKIVPKGIGKNELNSDPQAMQKLVQELAALREKISKQLKKAADVQVQFMTKSNTSANVQIIRFLNDSALQAAKQRIEKIKDMVRVHNEYDIQFRPIDKADKSTQVQVGYIPKTQAINYSIDIKHKTDPLSRLLKKHLVSRSHCKIKLLVLNGCHSYILGKIFSEYVENVICINPYVKIQDRTATTFAQYFYAGLHEYVNPTRHLKESVLRAYIDAKGYLSKDCANDTACKAHSHSHPNDRKPGGRVFHQQQFSTLHCDNDWGKLQTLLNDKRKFREYRKEMRSQGLYEGLENLYDGRTLILSNVSEAETSEIVDYLEDFFPSYNEEQTNKQIQCNEDDQKYVTDIESEDNDGFGNIGGVGFVKSHKYYKDEHYPELSYAYLKFQTTPHRRLAQKILSDKQDDETAVFSRSVHYDQDFSHQDDEKEHKRCSSSEGDMYSNTGNLGWIYRAVPPCCCAPQHPHLSQDKWMLLREGKLINRTILASIQQIHSGLEKKRTRDQHRQQVRMKRMLPRVDSVTEEGRDSSSMSTASDTVNSYRLHSNNTHTKGDEERSTTLRNSHSSHNTFGDDHINTSEQPTFKNDFGRSKSRRKLNNFGTDATTKKKSKRQSQNFRSSKKLSLNDFSGGDETQRNRNRKKQPKMNNFASPKAARKNNNFQSNNFGTTESSSNGNDFASAKKPSNGNNFGSAPKKSANTNTFGAAKALSTSQGNNFGSVKKPSKGNSFKNF